jgi:molybdenum cofactor biosynthesis protein MoaC
MKDITSKISTLRIATASAKVKVSSTKTIEAVKNNTVPKGNVLEMSKAAGLLGVKNTPLILPDCHPIPIESTKIDYTINDIEIIINVTVKTIYKTGVEVEAMHGASVVALNIYDMLKPIDKGVFISDVKLENKKGGKSEYSKDIDPNLTASVFVCSDSVSAGKKQDFAGKAIISELKNNKVNVVDYVIIPDNENDIKTQLKKAINKKIDLIIYTGGTGLSKTDITPETLMPLIERRIPGVEEAMRSYGQNRTPYAMLSRSLAGLIGDTLVLSLPGSTGGAKETMKSIFPSILHVFHIIQGGKRH